jgi:hypothetical protein
VDTVHTHIYLLLFQSNQQRQNIMSQHFTAEHLQLDSSNRTEGNEEVIRRNGSLNNDLHDLRESQARLQESQARLLESQARRQESQTRLQESQAHFKQEMQETYCTRNCGNKLKKYGKCRRKAKKYERKESADICIH